MVLRRGLTGDFGVEGPERVGVVLRRGVERPLVGVRGVPEAGAWRGVYPGPPLVLSAGRRVFSSSRLNAKCAEGRWR